MISENGNKFQVMTITSTYDIQEIRVVQNFEKYAKVLQTFGKYEGTERDISYEYVFRSTERLNFANSVPSQNCQSA